jgi:hypothetical protein
MNSRNLHGEVWDKYSDEFRSEVEKRKGYKTVEFADYEEIAELLRGRHHKDFEQAAIQSYLESAPPPGEGGTGTAMGGGAIDTGEVEVPEHWKPHLTENFGSIAEGLRAIQDMLRRRADYYGEKMTIEQYMEQMANDQIIKDGKGTFKTMDLTGDK